MSIANNGWRGSCTALASATTPLLDFDSREELPRAYSVCVKAFRAADNKDNPRAVAGQVLACTIFVGGVEKKFSVGFKAGGVVFDVVCERLTINVVNPSAAANDVLTVDGSVTRYVEGVPWKDPTSTVLITWVNGVAQNSPVPRYAKEVSITKTSTTTLTMTLLDAAGAVLGTLAIGSMVITAPFQVKLPGSMDSFQATPGANMTSIHVYTLGL